jgi:hypothetical protein
MFDDLISWLQEAIKESEQAASDETPGGTMFHYYEGKKDSYKECLEKVLIAREGSQK